MLTGSISSAKPMPSTRWMRLVSADLDHEADQRQVDDQLAEERGDRIGVACAPLNSATAMLTC